MRPQSRIPKVSLALRISPVLKAELELEAWESGQPLGAYVCGLLASRGKWARTVGKAGGYLLAPPEAVIKPRKHK